MLVGFVGPSAKVLLTTLLESFHKENNMHLAVSLYLKSVPVF